MGDQVAEGDILAEYDLEDLQRLAQESKLLLAQKQSELDRLTQQKTDADAQLQQKIDQLRASGSEQKGRRTRSLAASFDESQGGWPLRRRRGSCWPPGGWRRRGRPGPPGGVPVWDWRGWERSCSVWPC